jgi:tripartite-type tricarboxylate transporter receptor subunit TctC
MKFRKLTVLFAVLCIAALLSAPTTANAYPDRPITYIIGWATGGGSDLVSRVLCAEAEKHLGQPIVIVNRPGGSGAKAYVEISQARPDGYTIGNTTGTISTHKFMGVIPIGHEAFEVVITFNSDPGALWVKKDAPWKTLEEFVEDARKRPEEIVVAASNPGSITRLGLQLLEVKEDIKFRIASQAGGESAGPGLVAGGHVDACQAAPVTAKSLYDAGEIRPLGVQSEVRVDAFPEIPTFMEQGYDVVMHNTRQILAPKGTPKEVVDKLYQAFKAATKSETFVKFMNESGSMILDWDQQKSTEFLTAQDEQFKELLQQVGLYKEAK